MKKIIITGASGPLGVMLVRKCIRENVEVLAVVRPGSGRRNDLPPSPMVQTVECDISDILRLAETVNGKYDVCFHFAWTHIGDSGRNNPLLQSENIINALKTVDFAEKLGCKAFVGAGSQAEYGIHDEKINEDSVERPVTIYGITKLAAGRLVREYCGQKNMRCNWVRIFSVYGPYENEFVLTSYIIRTLLNGQKPVLTPCEQIWDYLYCEDAVRALFLIGEKAKDSGVYCLASGEVRTLRDCVAAIRDRIDPLLPLGIGERGYGENQIMRLEADVSKIRGEIGFEPRYTFEEGISKTVEWYKQRPRTV